MSKKIKILIADDRKEDRRLLRKMLESRGHEVQEASDGREGLEMLRLHKPDLIISDALMPEMDGFRFLRNVKKDEALKTTPFIFYTATYTGEKDEKLALALGARAFVEKPVPPDEFLERLETIIQQIEAKAQPAPVALIEEEEAYLRQYSDVVASRLEEKVAELEKANQDLQTEISERKQAEEALKKRSHDLEERMKELHCLYGITRLVEKSDTPYEALIQGIVELMPPAWQYPEITCARIILEDRAFKTDNFKETIWKQTRDIISDGEKIGVVEVFYLEERPESDDGPFMREETELINACAKRLGRIVERLRIAKKEQRLQSQLQQAQKMEAIGTLAGGISHDFNNILSVVLGYTELALQTSGEGSLLTRNLHEVYNAGKRARDLINHILTFSRQAEHEEPIPVQVKLIVNETLKLLRASLPSTIEIRQDTQSDATIMADPTQIHRVLMNLCTNAGHAMQKNGGILEVNLVNVEVDADFAARHLDMFPGPYLKLTVSDTGYGIDPTLIDRVFDLYFTTKEKGEGTGMGLSVVSGIVKSYGGAITVYSEPGKGTTFNVFLPVLEGVVESKTQNEAPLPGGDERILFVDDEPMIVDVGRQLLGNLGYDVVGTVSSLEALDLFRSNPEGFDLVITDMTMPHMTGDILAKEIMKLKPGIPIILCTGYSEFASEEGVKALGISAFAMKPLLKRELATAVRGVLDDI
ncbi:MAG: response regulator [Deltaproteobacteria bacterium]|nr:response regulator [Deltaproteobacteria bacterium]